MWLLSEWRMIGKNWRQDLVAGITVGIVALPLALGFAITTGASPTSGIVTAIVAGFVAALFGGSNYQVSGPTGAMTVVLIPIVDKYGLESLFLLGICAGALIIGMALLNLGRFIDSVPLSVMEGFTLGIALIIALQQVPLVFNVEKASGTKTLDVAVATSLDALSKPISWASVNIVILTILIKRLWPILKRKFSIKIGFPASLVALLISTFLAEYMNLQVARIGELPKEFNIDFNFDFPKVPLGQFFYAALVVALLGAIESLLSARVADAVAARDIAHGLKGHNPNQELIGQGLATIVSVLAGGLPATGAIARTSVNVHAGARTRLSAMIHSLFLLLVVLVLSPIVALIPTAALAGVLLGTSIRIANPRSVKESLNSTFDFKFCYLSTATAVLLIDLIWGIAIGLMLHATFNYLKKRRKT